MNSQVSSKSYFLASRNLFYSLLAIFPMLFLYEFLGFINNFKAEYQIRNGADAMVRQLFSIFGPFSQLLYGITLFLIFCYIGYKHRDILLKGEIKIHILMIMIIESFAWGGALLIIMKVTNLFFLASPISSDLLEQFYLSIGAGIWEELIFRLGMINLFTYLIASFFKYNKLFSIFLSLMFSAALFSIFHYIGIYGDIFTWQTFILRMVAGLFLGSVFLFRGLGISVYTHIMYDIVLVTVPVLV